ncbi:MAG: histidine phosphatase family protein [Chloroflexi bacterium]|nr:histidine phosphatase family protein [Chloroflexota bacterium]
MLTLEIFIHMDAVDRSTWQGAADDRPLTALGEQQSARMAAELTAGGPVQAIFSSQALRCRASLAPLSARLGLPIRVLPEFQDSAEKALTALQQIHEAVPDGRAVLCSYGDVVPALLTQLSAEWRQPPPERDTRKGAVFTLRHDGAAGSVTARAPSPEFPV